MTQLEQFDNATRIITDERGASYGHPSVDFDRVYRLKSVVASCPDPLVRHTLEMLCVKIARLIESPQHLDSWIDVAGYARCGVMLMEPPKVDK